MSEAELPEVARKSLENFRKFLRGELARIETVRNSASFRKLLPQELQRSSVKIGEASGELVLLFGFNKEFVEKVVHEELERREVA